MVRAGGTLALGLRVLCRQQGPRVLSVAQLTPVHNQFFGIGVPLASELLTGSFTFSISTSPLAWTLSAVQ